MNTEPIIDKSTCWYNKDTVCHEMNRNLINYLKVLDTTEHLKSFSKLVAAIDGTGLRIMDLGCGTAMISLFCKQHHYAGADMEHIIKNVAQLNYPQYNYLVTDIEEGDLRFLLDYDIVIINAVIDVMQRPIEMLEKVLDSSKDYVILHRQELSAAKDTHIVKNQSYGGETYHSVINRAEFEAIIKKCNFEIMEEEQCGFTNWEGNGSSFLLKRQKSWSLHLIDHLLCKKYFSESKPRFFIEVGANDGLRQSNSMYFEFYQNWRGILIEPMPELAKQCKENRSPNTIVENFALVAPSYSKKTIEMLYTPGSYGLMSLVSDNKYKEAQLQKMKTEKPEKIKVPATTLNSILAKHSREFTHIDLLCLDVEGYELEALQGIDFDKWMIHHLLVEELEDNCEVAEYLKQWYHRVERLGEHDIVYVRKEIHQG